LRVRWRHLPVKSGSYTPFISIILVVRNEAKTIETKLRDLGQIAYPKKLYEIIVVSDGSEDATNEVLARKATDEGIRAIVKSESQGKAAALNDAVIAAKGELLVFTDARQRVEPDAVARLAKNFADITVGCASGELMLGDPEVGETATRMGLYWRIEKKVRELESASGSTVGATGAFYAVRRGLLVQVPQGTVLDDVYIPMNVVRQGRRVIFDSNARAWDVADQGLDREFARKVRTLGGNYQLVELAPWLLSTKNPIRFEFVSHKLFRLLTPFALMIVLVTSILIPGSIYRVALVMQLGFYGLSVIAAMQWIRGPLARIADAAFTFVVLNTAAAVAFINFVLGRKVAWGN